MMLSVENRLLGHPRYKRGREGGVNSYNHNYVGAVSGRAE